MKSPAQLLDETPRNSRASTFPRPDISQSEPTKHIDMDKASNEEPNDTKNIDKDKASNKATEDTKAIEKDKASNSATDDTKGIDVASNSATDGVVIVEDHWDSFQ